MNQDKEQLMESSNGKRVHFIALNRRRGGGFILEYRRHWGEGGATMVTALTVIGERGELLLCCLLPGFVNSFLSG